jgi:hypothetical protein
VLHRPRKAAEEGAGEFLPRRRAWLPLSPRLWHAPRWCIISSTCSTTPCARRPRPRRCLLRAVPMKVPSSITWMVDSGHETVCGCNGVEVYGRCSLCFSRRPGIASSPEDKASKGQFGRHRRLYSRLRPMTLIPKPLDAPNRAAPRRERPSRRLTRSRSTSRGWEGQVTKATRRQRGRCPSRRREGMGPPAGGGGVTPSLPALSFALGADDSRRSDAGPKRGLKEKKRPPAPQAPPAEEKVGVAHRSSRAISTLHVTNRRA